MRTDYLIVGQGLAGTVLAWQLLERGASVLVVDRGDTETSSRVAAGIMTPITGKRIALTWRIGEIWPAAAAFYRDRERALGASFFHEVPIVRLFAKEEEARLWEKKRERPDLQEWLADEGQSPRLPEDIVDPGHGGFVMANCGWVDVNRFLDASRDDLERAGRYRRAAFDEAAFDPDAETLRWDDVDVTKAAIHCAGYGARESRFFDWVPFKAAKGEILDLDIADLDEARILNRGNWLLPLGGGRFRTGTTYAWDRLDSEPTDPARREIEEKLRRFVPGDYRVTGHRAAVRPIIRASRVLFGRHPAHDRLGFFNGLGSKGVLNAPFFAAQFADHLERGAPIEEEMDLRKNL